MRIDGGCHCISYEAEIDEGAVRICHCTDCQKLTGTAFRVSVSALGDSFRITAGEPRLYVKIADSGNRRIQAFCPQCGSPIYATSGEPGPQVYGIRVGTINQRDRLVPSRQYWRRSVLEWVDHVADIQAKDGN